MQLECLTACVCLTNCHENKINILQNDHLLFEVTITVHFYPDSIFYISLLKFKKLQIHKQNTF